MIIQCEKCRTKFRLNEDIVKDDGSNVRCSLCKHIFIVYPMKQEKDQDQKTVPEIEERHDVHQEVLDDEIRDKLDSDDGFKEDSMEDISALEFEYERGHQDVVALEPAEENPSHIEDVTTKAVETDFISEPIARDNKKDKAGKISKTIILVLAGFALIGAGVYIYLYPPNLISDFLPLAPKTDQQQKKPDTGASRLEILTVEGAFVNSKKAGRLFVIRGKVVNNYPQARSFILIKGSILDDKGQVVRERSAYAGNSFSNEDLNLLSVEKISRAMNDRQGVDNSNINVAPGTTMDFTIVFEKLPDNMSEFTVGAVSSSPAAPGHDNQG